MVVGDNGVLTQSQQASTKTAVSSFLEEANMAYADLYAQNMDNGDFSTNIELIDLYELLTNPNKGYRESITPVTKGIITGITLSETDVTLVTGITGGDSKTITVTPVGAEGTDYYVQIKGAYYKMNLTSSGITLGEALSQLPSGAITEDATVSPTTYNGGLTVTPSGTSIVLGLTSEATAAQTITVSYAGQTAPINVTIKAIISGVTFTNPPTEIKEGEDKTITIAIDLHFI